MSDATFAGRWCGKCQAWGDHHTDRHDQFVTAGRLAVSAVDGWKLEYTERALELIAADDRESAITAAVTGCLSTISDDTDRESGRARTQWAAALAVRAPDVEVPSREHLDLGEEADKILEDLREEIQVAVRSAIDKLRAVPQTGGLPRG